MLALTVVGAAASLNHASGAEHPASTRSVDPAAARGTDGLPARTASGRAAKTLAHGLDTVAVLAAIAALAALLSGWLVATGRRVEARRPRSFRDRARAPPLLAS